MERPVCVLVDDDPGTLAGLTRELRHHYGADYEFLPAPDARAGLRILERLGASGRPVALVLADLNLADIGGTDLLRHARHLHPLAKRVLLVDYWDFISAELGGPLRQAMTLGQADSWLTKPWNPPGQLLNPLIGELLGEWLEDTRRGQTAVALVVGAQMEPGSQECRDLLDRNSIPYQFHAAESVEGSELLRRAGEGEHPLPVVVLPDGHVLVRPTRTDVAAALGIRTRPHASPYDLAVVGAGPAGLSAAVYAASEGLRTVLIEREAFGGQAGTSARIRNYLGFSRGLSGRYLAREARIQAMLFGAHLVYGEAAGLRLEGTQRVVLMKDGSSAVASAVLVATGLTVRRLGVPAVEEFVGTGVFYSAGLTEAQMLRGADVLVVGAGNSAGQAVVHLSRYARQVTLVVRGAHLEESMSDYLVRELETLENVTVRLQTQVVGASGMGRLEQVTLAEVGSTPHTVAAAALFIQIGAMPQTAWLTDALQRDASGFVLTGRELRGAGQMTAPPRPARDPFAYESSMPGVFAAGDVRANSVKRVASAVGEGSIAIHSIHEYLRSGS